MHALCTFYLFLCTKKVKMEGNCLLNSLEKECFFDMILLGWATDFCNFAHMTLFSLSSGEMNRS